MTIKGSWNRNNPKDMGNSFYCQVCGFGPKSCKCSKKNPKKKTRNKK